MFLIFLWGVGLSFLIQDASVITKGYLFFLSFLIILFVANVWILLTFDFVLDQRGESCQKGNGVRIETRNRRAIPNLFGTTAAHSSRKSLRLKSALPLPFYANLWLSLKNSTCVYCSRKTVVTTVTNFKGLVKIELLILCV